MKMTTGGTNRLGEAEIKQYAFCMGGVSEFYQDRHRIGGRYFAFCHVLGELTYRVCRVPTMTFLSPEVRSMFKQQLCEIGRQAMREIKTDEGVSRDDSRAVIDMAVETFGHKGRARDMHFSERMFAIRPDVIDNVRMQQNYPHEYQAFLQSVRQRVMVGTKADKPKR